MGVLRVKVNGQWIDIGSGAPSAGAVYGVNHYVAQLGPSTVIPSGTPVVLGTINMPASPAGTLLDIGWVGYMNQGTGGTGSTFLTVRVNGVDQYPTVVVGDRVQLESYCGRCLAAAPANVAYTVTLVGVKASAGGTIQAQGSNTLLTVVSYRP